MHFETSLIGCSEVAGVYEYAQRDAQLYALSVGERCGMAVHPGCDQPALPTIVAAATHPVCVRLLEALGPGLDGVIHRYEAATFFSSLPHTARLESTGTIIGVRAVGALTEVQGRIHVRLTTGVPVAEVVFAVVYRQVLPITSLGTIAARKRVQPPPRPPDFHTLEPTMRNQALLYSLTGDDNPLHIDDAFAQERGFDRAILHGLCTFGVLGRIALETRPPATSLRALEVELREPIYPGETLMIEGWLEANQVLLRAKAHERSDGWVVRHAVASFAPDTIDHG